MIFLIQLINSVSGQVLWRNKFNLLLKHPNRHDNCFFIWKRSLFGQINFTNSKCKAWRFYTRLFFLLYKKVVVVLLKYRLSTLERTPIFILGYKRSSKSVGNMVFYQIKRKRERKIDGIQKETLIFFSYTRNYIFIFSLPLVFDSHARLSYFSLLKGYKSF